MRSIWSQRISRGQIVTSNSINSNALSKEEVVARLKELGIQFGEPEVAYWIFIEAKYERYIRKAANKIWTLPMSNHGTSLIKPGDKALIYISSQEVNRLNRSVIGIVTLASSFRRPDDKQKSQIQLWHSNDDEDHRPENVLIADIADAKQYPYNLQLNQFRKRLPSFQGKSWAKVNSMLRRTPLKITEFDCLIAEQFGLTGQ